MGNMQKRCGLASSSGSGCLDLQLRNGLLKMPPASSSSPGLPLPLPAPPSRPTSLRGFSPTLTAAALPLGTSAAAIPGVALLLLHGGMLGVLLLLLGPCCMDDDGLHPELLLLPLDAWACPPFWRGLMHRASMLPMRASQPDVSLNKLADTCLVSQRSTSSFRSRT